MFVGYFPTQSDYLCLNTSTYRLYTSCHVVESIFHFASSPTTLSQVSSSILFECCSMSLPVINSPSVQTDSATPINVQVSTDSPNLAQYHPIFTSSSREPVIHSNVPMPET